MIVLNVPQDLFHEGEELLRQFFGMEAVRPAPDGAQRLTFSADVREEKGAWRAQAVCTNGADAAFSGRGDMPRPLNGDALADKRARNRALKRALYAVCKSAVPEIETPWGALTGIRPTKLLYERMREGYNPRAAADYLIETYDVRPDKAELLLEIEAMQRGLFGREPARLVDVYIGIPFCPSRCAYCSFASTDVHKSGHLRTPYVAALTREMEAVAILMQDKGLSGANLYIGGGTPTALEEDQLERVLAAASRLFKPESGEFTLEAGRPDTMTRGKLEAALRYGVSRVSVNPQSMNDETLARIGRRHTARDIEDAYALVREMGFKHVNMDLIAGLSGETPEAFESSLARVVGLRPENVTVHTLSVKRASVLHEHPDRYDLSTFSDAGRMVAASHAVLTQNGYRPYYLYRQKYMSGNHENVGYALPGTQCGYNIDVMEETHGNIAMGAGAITKWFYPEKNLIRRAANVKNVEAYIARVDEMVARKARLADAQPASAEESAGEDT